jgi:HSP20 family protein
MDTEYPILSWFARDLDSLFGRAEPHAVGFEPRKAFWAPAVDVFERGGEFVVRADLPGMKREDITIEMTDGEMILRGERKHEKEEKKEGYYRSERSYGSFFRTIELPEGVKIDQAKAVARDGTLEVKIPIAKIESTRRRLEIQEGAAGEKSEKHAA